MSDSLNACNGSPEVCAEERDDPGDRLNISKMAFAITPLYWHSVGQTNLTSRPRNEVHILSGINNLQTTRSTAHKIQIKLGNICRILHRQRLPGCGACWRSNCDGAKPSQRSQQQLRTSRHSHSDAPRNSGFVSCGNSKMEKTELGEMTVAAINL